MLAKSLRGPSSLGPLPLLPPLSSSTFLPSASGSAWGGGEGVREPEMAPAVTQLPCRSLGHCAAFLGVGSPPRGLARLLSWARAVSSLSGSHPGPAQGQRWGSLAHFSVLHPCYERWSGPKGQTVPARGSHLRGGLGSKARGPRTWSYAVGRREATRRQYSHTASARGSEGCRGGLGKLGQQDSKGGLLRG